VTKLKEGDRCKLKGNDYIDLKVHKVLPKGAHGRKCVLVECLASGGSTPPNFDFAPIKTFRMIDLVGL
jgi:hypothetical protein